MAQALRWVGWASADSDPTGGLQRRGPEAGLARGSPLPRASAAIWGLCQERSCLVVQTAQRANPEASTTGSSRFQKGDVAPWALGPTREHPQLLCPATGSFQII